MVIKRGVTALIVNVLLKHIVAASQKMVAIVRRHIAAVAQATEFKYLQGSRQYGTLIDAFHRNCSSFWAIWI